MTMLVQNGVFRTPTGQRVKGQSYAKLEAAANVLRPQLPREPGEQFMLDCIGIFERTLPQGKYLTRVDEVEDMEEFAALTIPEWKVISMRIDVYDKLIANQVFGRSTVVHELSHLALQHHVTLHRGAAHGQHGFFEDSEWQAKALTGALMMPADAAQIARSPKQLALMCGTSEEAARHRIKTLVKLGLLTPSHSLWEYAEK